MNDDDPRDRFEIDDEMSIVGEALRDLPALRFPDDALESVLEKTVRARKRRIVAVRGGLAAAAAAAAIVAAVLLARDAPPLAPDAASLAKARSEVELALGVTGRALRRSEEIAARSAGARIAPALERVPFLNLLTNWNSTQERQRRP